MTRDKMSSMIEGIFFRARRTKMNFTHYLTKDGDEYHLQGEKPRKGTLYIRLPFIEETEDYMELAEAADCYLMLLDQEADTVGCETVVVPHPSEEGDIPL